jgi:hypothetical protein
METDFSSIDADVDSALKYIESRDMTGGAR